MNDGLLDFHNEKKAEHSSFITILFMRRVFSPDHPIPKFNQSIPPTRRIYDN